MDAARSPLVATLARELGQAADDGAVAVAEEIRRRHGETVSAMLFYGSCLRRASTEGVLDFYVLVDDVDRAHASRRVAWLNRVLPPNVLYLEHHHAGQVLRAKYAVMSLRQFETLVSLSSFDTRVWSRFCQPACLVWARGATVRERVAVAVARATLTAVERMRVWLPGKGPVQRFRGEELWQGGFRETYRAEPRSEGPETIAALYAAAPDRYEKVLREALHELERRGRLVVESDGEQIELRSDPQERARLRRAWRLRRPVAKLVAVLGIGKTPFTFDDWVSYVIFKLERHGGEPIEISDRQRRHPFLLGWPVLFRLIRRGTLR